MDSVTERIRHFIIDELGWEGTAEELTDDLLLIQEGALDSIGIVTLTSFLESYYGIIVEDSEIVPANLGSLASIERYVQAKETLTPRPPAHPAGYPQVIELERR